MENTLERIALCVEVGKINAKTPYPPAMKGEDGADELTQKALEQGYSPNDILTKGLIVGMNNIGVKFKENKSVCASGSDECKSYERWHATSEKIF